MALSLEDLIMQEILSPEQKRAQVEAQTAASMPGMLRKSSQTSQQQNEAAFGKGMGLSTWNAYQQALNSLMESEGAGTIRNQAQQSVDAAQRAAIGNAASYATAEKNRAAAQATANQTANIQKKSLSQQKSLANQKMVFEGLGGLASGAGGMIAREFKPEIKGGLRGLYGKFAGKGTPGQSDSPLTEAAPNVEQPYGAGIDQDLAEDRAPGLGYESMSSGGFSLSGPETSLPSYGGGYNFEMPSFANVNPSGWGGLDALLASSYENPEYFSVI